MVLNNLQIVPLESLDYFAKKTVRKIAKTRVRDMVKSAQLAKMVSMETRAKIIVDFARLAHVTKQQQNVTLGV
jgi:hypothetical protein